MLPNLLRVLLLKEGREMNKYFILAVSLLTAGCITTPLDYGYRDMMGPVEVKITSEPSGVPIMA